MSAWSPSPRVDALSDAHWFVKLLRIWLLVLLSVLLPVRGAMAATMLCTPAGGAAHSQVSITGHGAVHGHDGQSLADAARGHDHAEGDRGDAARDPANPDKCNVCSSSCSSPPLPSATTGIVEPENLTSVSFPDLCAPAPSFQSDGQERPPRTI